MNTPIKPSDIDTSRHFFGAFNKMEKEISAKWIVRFCQRKDSWEPFTYDELNAFYNETYKERFWFNGMDAPEYLTLVGENPNTYEVTLNFVASCYKASPKK